MDKILLIEDDKKISNLVSESLIEEGFQIKQAFDGEDGLNLIIENKFDLILLDIMVPKINGFKLCSQVRSLGIQTPILLLTAKSGEYDVEEGLDAGADDYLKKPFSNIELKARIRALLRRHKTKGNILTFDNLSLNSDARKVTVSENEVILTEREFDLLHYLLQNMNIVVSKEELMEEVWENLYPSKDELNNVEVYIGYLRKKLKIFNLDNYIKTIRGFGYRWG